MSNKNKRRRSSHSFDEFDEEDDIDIMSSPPCKKVRIDMTSLLNKIGQETNDTRRQGMVELLQSMLESQESMDNDFGRGNERNSNRLHRNHNNNNNNNNNNFELDRYSENWSDKNSDNYNENDMLEMNSNNKAKSARKNGCKSKIVQKEKEMESNEENVNENEEKKQKKVDQKPIVRLWLFMPSFVGIALSFRGKFSENYVIEAEAQKERVWLYWGPKKGTRNVSHRLTMDGFFDFVEKKRIDVLRKATFVIEEKEEESDKQEIEGMFILHRKKFRILLILFLFVVFCFILF